MFDPRQITVRRCHRNSQNKARQWIKLSPVLVSALRELATAEGRTVDALIAVLIDEALSARLRRAA